MNIHEKLKEMLEQLPEEFPLCEYAFGKPSEIPFSDKIFTICETDCPRYGHSWACPPNAGKIEDNIARLNHYHDFFVFSTIWEVEDSWDIQKSLAVKVEHEAVTRSIREKLLSNFSLPLESTEENPTPPIYFLSAGCTICEECACPKEPCLHPKERLMTMESHGVLIMKLIEDLGMTYSFDVNTIAYFTMILF